MNEVLVLVGVLAVMGVVGTFFIINEKIKMLERIVKTNREILEQQIEEAKRQIKFESNSRQIGYNLLRAKLSDIDIDLIRLKQDVNEITNIDVKSQSKVTLDNKMIGEIVYEVVRDLNKEMDGRKRKFGGESL